MSAAHNDIVLAHKLELRCAGENPKALDIKGIDVAARQYAAVVFGGLMAGLGGAFLTVVTLAAVLNLTRDYRQRLVNTRVMLSLRRSLFERMLRLPLSTLPLPSVATMR